MRMMKCLLLILWFLSLHIQPAGGAKAATFSGAGAFDEERDRFVAALKMASKPVLETIGITTRSRNRYIWYLGTSEAIADIQENNPAHEIELVKLRGDINTFVGRLEEIGTHTKAIETALRFLLEKEGASHDLHAILNTCMWDQFNMTLSTSLFLYEIPTLLKVYPEVRKIYRQELNILESILENLLCLASPAYQNDFLKYRPVCVARGSLSVISRDSGEIFVRDESFSPRIEVRREGIYVITSAGARVLLPFMSTDTLRFKQEFKDEDMVTKAGTLFFCLYCKFASDFEIQLYRITGEERDRILMWYGFGNAEFQRKQKKIEEKLRAKKTQRDRASSSSSGAETVSAEALELLWSDEVSLGTIKGKGHAKPPRKPKDRVGKKTSVLSQAVPLSSFSAKEKVEAGAISSLVSETVLDLASVSKKKEEKEKIPCVDPALKATILRLADEVSKKEIKSGTVMLSRPTRVRTGLNKNQLNTLLILLSKPAIGETLLKAVHTVKWPKLVSLLEGLGFRHRGDGTFMHITGKELHLHIIHYDNGRINKRLLDILWDQLEFYGYTKDVLESYCS